MQANRPAGRWKKAQYGEGAAKTERGHSCQRQGGAGGQASKGLGPQCIRALLRTGMSALRRRLRFHRSPRTIQAIAVQYPTSGVSCFKTVLVRDSFRLLQYQ